MAVFLAGLLDVTSTPRRAKQKGEIELSCGSRVDARDKTGE